MSQEIISQLELPIRCDYFHCTYNNKWISVIDYEVMLSPAKLKMKVMDAYGKKIIRPSIIPVGVQ